MLTDLERLVSIEEIKNLKARYFRTMDTGDWDGLGTVFASDAVFDFSQAVMDPVDNPVVTDGPEPVAGGDAIVAAIRDAVSTANTVHHGHMPEIALTSATSATGTWALNDILIWPNGMRLDGYGHYDETYEKLGDDWRIRSSKLTRLHVDVIMPEEAE